MLVDEVEVSFAGGHGGTGRSSFYPKLKAGPDGGNGGKGGNLYIVTTADLTALNKFSAHKDWQADDGQPGGRNRKTGKDGVDLIIQLPVGSILTDIKTNQIFELLEPNQKILLCQGGLGGRGNYEFRSSRNTTPTQFEPGLPGQQRHLQVTLKLIADFGLIGLPSAGKSSLLNELTATHVKTASYPFTTLEPNLGSLDGKIIADIPGLIAGASLGKGLGFKFLKHIEKVGMLLHCLAVDSTQPVRDYQIIRAELQEYNPSLLNKPELVILTKTDLVGKSELKILQDKIRKLNKKSLAVSIYDLESILKLRKYLVNFHGKD
ncbi:GTPase ObgE [Patescibacteria group bacterium]|nr:GTPase ObgE [Patescibacteria group bacterium]MCL5409886.1 GTPase ObgE [Patescibacteria group bacterium]